MWQYHVILCGMMFIISKSTLMSNIMMNVTSIVVITTDYVQLIMS